VIARFCGGLFLYMLLSNSISSSVFLNFDTDCSITYRGVVLMQVLLMCSETRTLLW